MIKNKLHETEDFYAYRSVDMSQVILDHYYRNLEDNIFYVSGEIAPSVLDLVGIPLLRADEKNFEMVDTYAVGGNGESIFLEQTPAQIKPITIYINTEGGEMYNGFILCDIISQLKSPTTLIVLGLARSMGAFLLLAGYNNENVVRKCFPFSHALIHDGSGTIEGANAQIKDYYQFLEKYQAKKKQFVLDNSKITPEEYESLERHEWYMTAEDMLKYGLVDEIIR